MLNAKALFFLLITVILWGTAPVIEKTALKNSDPLSAVFIRSIFITVLLIIVLTASGKWNNVLYNTSLRDKMFFCLSGLMAGALGMFTYFMALKYNASSLVVPIAASYPLIAAVLGIIFLGETFTFIRLAGIILIILGVWLVKL